MPGFERTFSEAQLESLVAYLRFLQAEPAKATEGNPVNGRLVFFQGERCSKCHMVNGQGGFLGCDLSGYGRTHSAESIREWILHPDKSADQPATAVAILKNKTRYIGVIRNEDNFSLQMQTADGAFHSLDKSELSSLEHSSVSLMPSFDGPTLSRSQLQDLVSFLMTAPVNEPAKTGPPHE